MDLSPANTTYVRALRWLRMCRAESTHFVLRSIALRCPDGWRALWTTVVLGDAAAIPDAAIESVDGVPDVALVRAAHPYRDLVRLLSSIRRSTLPSWATGHPTSILLSWKDGAVPNPEPLWIETSPERYRFRRPRQRARLWNTYPHALLKFNLGSLPEWWNNQNSRYQWLGALDGYIRRSGCRDLIDLGVRAGFLDDETGQGSATNASPFLFVVAPHLVHIDQITVDRSTGALWVDIERSPLLVNRELSATLVENGRVDSPRPAATVPAGSTSVRIAFDDVQGDQAEVALHDEAFPAFSVRAGTMRSRYVRTARSVVAALMSKGGLGDLKSQLLSAQGIDVEEPARQLLFLLGYSPWKLDRNATQPPGVPDGILRFDILAFDAKDAVLLAVEVTTGLLVPEKLAKLVTRANALRLFLAAQLSGEGDAPMVQPVLIITTERAPAPSHLITAAADYQVGLIAREDLAELVDHLAAGDNPAARRRFDACFPNNLWTGTRSHTYRIGTIEEW